MWKVFAWVLLQPQCKFGSRAYIIDRSDHVGSACTISPTSIVPFSFPQPCVDVVNGALAADEATKVLFHLNLKSVHVMLAVTRLAKYLNY